MSWGSPGTSLCQYVHGVICMRSMYVHATMCNKIVICFETCKPPGLAEFVTHLKNQPSARSCEQTQDTIYTNKVMILIGHSLIQVHSPAQYDPMMRLKKTDLKNNLTIFGPR